MRQRCWGCGRVPSQPGRPGLSAQGRAARRARPVERSSRPLESVCGWTVLEGPAALPWLPPPRPPAFLCQRLQTSLSCHRHPPCREGARARGTLPRQLFPRSSGPSEFGVGGRPEQRGCRYFEGRRGLRLRAGPLWSAVCAGTGAERSLQRLGLLNGGFPGREALRTQKSHFALPPTGMTQLKWMFTIQPRTSGIKSRPCFR